MSCLFRSIGVWVQEPASVVRKKICDYLDANREVGFDGVPLHTFLDTFPSQTGETPECLVERYTQAMRKSSTWGGALEIRAAAELYSRCITVVSLRPSDHSLFAKGLRFHPTSGSEEEGLEIKLSWNGSHFEPLTEEASNKR